MWYLYYNGVYNLNVKRLEINLAFFYLHINLNTTAGWYLNKELTTPYYFNQTLSNDTTLYAKWDEIKITVVDIEEPKNIQTGATDTKILLLTITMVAASILLIRRK